MALMHYYLPCVYILFEFLSFEEFKFVKSASNDATCLQNSKYVGHFKVFDLDI